MITSENGMPKGWFHGEMIPTTPHGTRIVLRFGFLQDRGVGVGIFPEGEEALVGFVACERVSAATLACFRVGMSGSASFQRRRNRDPCLQRARESPDRGGIFPACSCPASEEACHPVPSLPRIPRDRNREALP
jgi:hypothetical protein